jgi:glycosyltransferase involved in cell wall biosynthesis
LKQGFRVGADFEDWFSEDLPSAARRRRPVLELAELEGRLLREGVYTLTTSESLADALASRFSAPRPTVVRNVFPLGSDPDVCFHQPVRLHWFSQTIGPNRGLELLFSALTAINVPIEVHLRGTRFARYDTWLQRSIPAGWHDRVILHDCVPNDQLHAAIAEHDIGLALESSAILNRDLSITNKMFQYLNAGLAVIATHTTGQAEALRDAPGAGILIGESAQELADAVNALAGNTGRLIVMRRAARAAARDRLCWEHEEKRLLVAYEKALRLVKRN